MGYFDNDLAWQHKQSSSWPIRFRLHYDIHKSRASRYHYYHFQKDCCCRSFSSFRSFKLPGNSNQIKHITPFFPPFLAPFLWHPPFGANIAIISGDASSSAVIIIHNYSVKSLTRHLTIQQNSYRNNTGSRSPNVTPNTFDYLLVKTDISYRFSIYSSLLLSLSLSTDVSLLN